jgi:hypothetical protein
MAVAVRGISPVAHLPLVLGILRKLQVAFLIDEMIPLWSKYSNSPSHGR